jgi:DNA-3-methyladenine glycosylase II
VSESPCGESHTHADVKLGIVFDRLLVMTLTLGGQWTVDMFLIFTLRRPDILPVGDLGVQKGLLKWILAAYEHTIPVAPSVAGGKGQGGEVQDSSIIPAPIPALDPVVPPPPTSIVSKSGEPPKQKKAEQKGLEKALLSLDVRPDEAKLREMFPLPEGMDVGLLRSRLGGKKAK